MSSRNFFLSFLAWVAETCDFFSDIRLNSDCWTWDLLFFDVFDLLVLWSRVLFEYSGPSSFSKRSGSAPWAIRYSLCFYILCSLYYSLLMSLSPWIPTTFLLLRDSVGCSWEEIEETSSMKSLLYSDLFLNLWILSKLFPLLSFTDFF